MKAWYFHEVGKPLTLEEIPDPVPGPGEVVIRTRAAGLCHSDIGYMDGTLASLLGPLPIVLGHETAGVVAELGAGVTGFRVGDRVAINADVDGPGTLIDGGFAEKVLARARELVRIPDGVDFDQAATATDAGRTSYHAVRTIGRVTGGTRVGLIGLGGLGMLGAAIAVSAGAEVHAAEINEDVHDRARAIGVRKIVKDVAELADDDLEVIIDFAGFGTTTAGAIDAVRRKGRVVQVGLARETATISVQNLVLKEVQLLGSVTGSNADVAGVLAMIADGTISAEVTPVPFTEIPAGFDRLIRGQAHGRLVAHFDDRGR
ncbi:propanol-preferring alcohol dehydrogenase [Actinocorallia herbida]|uniref:alcohol dehydrogenase n=1 Tax=Actinocorallia herbida TaxID=58109 RepID=A0A3N1CZT1_9ACTN|nr:zinc-binding dehydrogenase [Actinocorallia herbida]ROO86790.1 propanol-preferring alcohol dehydrogenase [Actinocorallia herbida]